MQLIAPEVSIRAMEWLLIADLPVIVLAAYALIVTRPHEGSALRGLAIAASALSFINVLLLGNSLSVLLASAH